MRKLILMACLLASSAYAENYILRPDLPDESVGELVPGEADLQQQLEENNQISIMDVGGVSDTMQALDVGCQATECSIVIQVDRRQSPMKAVTVKRKNKKGKLVTVTVYVVDQDKRTTEQTARLFVEGRYRGSWNVSTGVTPGHTTIRYNGHPSGPIYHSYSSRAHPGGDFYQNGENLGNMPWAVFFNVRSGYALHGTAAQSHLGTQASHGCVRMDNAWAPQFNALVKQYGLANTWVIVNDGILYADPQSLAAQ